jgi:hypothetical protein
MKKYSDYSEMEIKEIQKRWASLEKDIEKYISPDGELLDDNFEAERVLKFSLSEASEVIFGTEK